MLRITRKRLHPIAQHCPVNPQIARGLRDTSPTLLDQLHRLEPEFSRKLPSLHDPPPVPAKHLTRCLRNRQQAKKPMKLYVTITGLHGFKDRRKSAPRHEI